MRKILLLAAALLLTIPCTVVYAGDDDPIDAGMAAHMVEDKAIMHLR